MKQLATLNPEKASKEEINNYPVRQCARAVVFDKHGNVALLHVTKINYYKLPGGGLEGDENPIDALRRECVEEIGSDVKVMAEIGSVTEYRKAYNLTQISYCYVAKPIGKKQAPTFMTDEIEEGFQEIWLPYDQALKALQNSQAANIEGKLYIVPRDKLILEKAKKHVV